MPRTARLNEPGVLYHIISRFVDREYFIESDEERETYLRMLGHALDDTDWRCLAYALMSTHLHFAMVAGADDLQAWAKAAHTPFAQWMNQRHGRLGPLFANRPADYAVPPHRVGAVLAYVHNNPVRAGVVTFARDSTWTSHRAYLGTSKPSKWLHVDEGFERSGFVSRQAFDEFVIGERDEVEAPDIRRVRQELRRRGGLNTATPGLDGIPIVIRPSAHVRPDALTILATAAQVLRIGIMVLCSRRRLEPAIVGRRITVHAAKALGLCGAEIADALGISEQAVSKIAKQPLDDAGDELMRRIFRGAHVAMRKLS